MARDPVACDLGGDLHLALELLAMVQSVPEFGRAVVNFGNRDSAFDAGLPQPVAHYRQGAAGAVHARGAHDGGYHGPARHADPCARQRGPGRRYSGVYQVASLPDF